MAPVLVLIPPNVMYRHHKEHSQFVRSR